jgi:hypothetical protein
MEPASVTCLDSTEKADAPARKPAYKRKSRAKHVKLLSRENLDGRTTARKQFDAIASGIAADLGGEDRLSTIQKHLVEGFAGIAVVVSDLNCRLMLGLPVDVVEHCQTISTLIRAASRIGVSRIPHLLNGLSDTDTPAWSPMRSRLSEADDIDADKIVSE